MFYWDGICVQVRHFIYRTGNGEISYSDLERQFNLPKNFDLLAWLSAVNSVICPPPSSSNIRLSFDENGRPVRLNMFKYDWTAALFCIVYDIDFIF